MIGQRDSKFYSELKQLNEDLIEYLKQVQEKSPFFDFSPTLKDYIKQFADLEKSYPSDGFKPAVAAFSGPSPPKTAPTQNNNISNSNLSASAAPFVPSTTPFAFSSSKIPQMANSNNIGASINNTNTNNSLGNNLTFGTLPTSTTTPAAPSDASTTTTTATTNTSTISQPFLFGAALNPPLGGGGGLTSGSLGGATTQTASSPFFSFTLPPPVQKKEEEEKDADSTAGADEDTQPPEPKIDKYEEPDAKHTVKCKLYEKGKGTGSEINVNLLGIGTLFVKALDTPTKLQVIVRQEPDLRRVLLNEVISSNIPVKLLPKAVQIVFPSSTGETKFYILKVRDESDANTLYELLNFSKS